MGTLFLSGGGDKKHTEKFDQVFKEHIGIQKPLLYIPVAMKAAVPYSDCLQWAKSVFNPMGVHDIVMWTDLTDRKIEDLKQFSAVYIGGGNTFSLLNGMRVSRFDEVLKEYIKNGGIAYGGSAGAIIMGSHILTCSHLDENEVGLENYNGLNLLGDLAVWCHYTAEDDGRISIYLKEHGKPVLALSEETGAYFIDGQIKISGTKPAFLFKDESKIELMADSQNACNNPLIRNLGGVRNS